jgi:restriction endonuclease
LEDGIVRQMFEKEFNKLIKKGFTPLDNKHLMGFKEFSNLGVKKVHSGYFSKMKRDKSIEEDESAKKLAKKHHLLKTNEKE